MEVETAEKWVGLLTGPAAALLVLLAAVTVLAKWIDTELKINLENQMALIEHQNTVIAQQQEQLTVMRQGQELMAENQGILRETLQLERDQYTILQRLMFQNVDTPETP